MTKSTKIIKNEQNEGESTSEERTLLACIVDTFIRNLQKDEYYASVPISSKFSKGPLFLCLGRG